MKEHPFFVTRSAGSLGADLVAIFSGYGEEAVRKRVEDAGITFMFTSEKS